MSDIKCICPLTLTNELEITLPLHVDVKVTSAFGATTIPHTSPILICPVTLTALNITVSDISISVNPPVFLPLTLNLLISASPSPPSRLIITNCPCALFVILSCPSP